MLDPEDPREVTRAYEAGCEKVIVHFEGLCRQLQDGLLAYIGWGP